MDGKYYSLVRKRDPVTGDSLESVEEIDGKTWYKKIVGEKYPPLCVLVPPVPFVRCGVEVSRFCVDKKWRPAYEDVKKASEAFPNLVFHVHYFMEQDGPTGEFGNYVRNHARVPAVSVCEWMNFRNKLVMESNQAFVDWECLMIEPILRVGEKLGDSLYDFCGTTPDVRFILAIGARPFPNLVEHFAVKRADVGLLQRVGRCHGSAADRPLSSL